MRQYMNKERRDAGERRGQRAYEIDKKQRNQRIRQKSAYLIDNRGSIFGIIIMILLLVSIFAVLANKESVDFGGLLSILRGAPTIKLDWLNIPTIYLGDWGIFNGLRDFIGMLVDTVEVVSFIGTALVQVVLYVGYFLKVLLL